ncbi:MAG TPA: 50S ribosomal protein L30 [Candidatus Limnocylindria bacterium]
MAAERTPVKPGTVRVTWIRSEIGHKAAARGTIRALGLRRLHHTVDVVDTPQTRGMLRRVAFLIEVEEPEAGTSKETA